MLKSGIALMVLAAGLVGVWLLGFVTAVFGGWIHLTLILAVLLFPIGFVLVVVHFIRRPLSPPTSG